MWQESNEDRGDEPVVPAATTVAPMVEVNRKVVLRRRPTGLVVQDDVELVEEAMAPLEDGQARVLTTHVGVDAAVRTWLDGEEGYLPALQLGDVIRSGSVGEIVESRCDAYEVGDVVTTLGGFCDYTIVADDLFTTKVDRDVDQKAMLAVFGSTGATAYFGMNDIGKPTDGETAVVSAAAGATGSLAGQIARAMGASRVVGIAGSDQKCQVVVDEFGFDSCINYKTADLKPALREHCPDRIDVYFDNVGGEVLDAVLGGLAHGGRVALCGVISSYLTGEHPGPKNYVKLLSQCGLMQGFNTLDEWGRFDEAFAELRAWVDAGQIVYRAQEFEGLDEAVPALNALFEGTNIGKTLLNP